MATDLDIAWAAGLFEGEGCFCIITRQDLPRASVLMADRDILERFQEVVGVGKIYKGGPPIKTVHRQRWTWQVTTAEGVRSVIDLLLPLLGSRRTAKALEVRECCERVLARKEPKAHCPQGHEYAGANLYIDPTGQQFCRACTNASSRRYQARKREKRERLVYVYA